jgi:hypothetical protein
MFCRKMEHFNVQGYEGDDFSLRNSCCDLFSNQCFVGDIIGNVRSPSTSIFIDTLLSLESIRGFILKLVYTSVFITLAFHHRMFFSNKYCLTHSKFIISICLQPYQLYSTENTHLSNDQVDESCDEISCNDV